MATNTTELVLKFTGDSRQLQQVVAAVRRDLSQLGQAAREVNRIMAETARQATAQERVRERAAKNLADVQVREAKRAAKELEKTIAAGRVGGGGGDLLGFASQAPLIGRFASQFSALETSAAAAGGAIASVAGPIAAVTIAATAGIAALALLGKTIFELSKQTAAFEGKFFDLSQQVGVSVETLSTLDVIASTTGGNIETVTVALGIFQKNLEASHDPTSKEAKLLKELGVTSLDTEVALRQSLKGLFALGEGAKQTNDVLQLFGRSGRFVNAILKESKGDIDAARVALGGLVVARDAAAAADAFNDSLEIMNRTLFAVVRQITGSAIPVFTVFFQQINQALTGNKNDWSSWSDVIQIEVAAALGAIQGFAQFVASQGNIPLGVAIDANIRTLIEQANQLKNQLRFESDVESIQRLTRSILAGKPGDTPDATKANREAQTRAAKDIQLQQQRLEEATRAHRVKLERERDLDIKNIDEWESESIIALADHMLAQGRIYEQELINAHRYVKNLEDLRLAEEEIGLKRQKTTQETLESIDRIRDEARKRREQAELSLNQQLLSIRDAEREGELRQIKADQDRGLIAESHAIQQQIALLKQAFDERKILRDLELAQETTSAARRAQLLNEQLEADRRYTDERKRLISERIRAIQQEAAEGTPTPNQGRAPTPISVDPGEPPAHTLNGLIALAVQAQGAFAGLGVVMSEVLGTGVAGAVAFADSLAASFSLVAQAAGEAVKAFILFGSAQGSFRKFAAEVVASIAQMAVIQAVWEAAQGLAMLALAYFTNNPKYLASAKAHFLAAAAYGIVAGAAVPIGRALAGNQFQQGGGGGGGGTSGAGGSTERGELNPITLGRNQAEPRRIIIELRAAKDKFSQAIEAVVVSDVNGAGRIRQAFADDGVF